MKSLSIIKKPIRDVGLYLSDLRSTIVSSKLRKVKLREKIVFVDQLQGANPNLIEKEYGSIHDVVAAKRFGARNLKEFSFWAWRACGIANVASVLASENKLGNKKLFDLIQIGLEKNGYVYRDRWGREDVGWKHSVLAEILSEHDLKVRQKSTLGPRALLAEMTKSRYIIASVVSDTGSHMILLKNFIPGVRNRDKIVYNDPYTFGEKGGENLMMSFKDWLNCYLGTAIIIW